MVNSIAVNVGSMKMNQSYKLVNPKTSLDFLTLSDILNNERIIVSNLFNFEKKIPKRRMKIKRNPYIISLNERQEGVMEPDKKLHHKRLRRGYNKSIKQGLEEE